jgi:hypothetical protein
MGCIRFLTVLFLLFPSVLMGQQKLTEVGMIQPLIQFPIPTTDGKTANAVYILTSDQKEILVIANSLGNLQVYFLSKDQTPNPPDPPKPPTPTPQKLTIAIVEDPCCTPLKQKAVLTDKIWRDKANAEHNFVGIIPSSVIDLTTNKPPAQFQVYLERAKTRTRPWLMFYGEGGQLLFEGAVPQSTAEMLGLLRQYGGK